MLDNGSSTFQLNLFEGGNNQTVGRNGTFSPNHKESVHRWYPYLEGFASSFVEGLLSEFGKIGCRVHDPFGGTGTTVLVAASRRSSATYTEVNPFMRLVVECKTNILNRLSSESGNKIELQKYFDGLVETAKDILPAEDSAKETLEAAFGKRLFFKGRSLLEIVALKKAIEQDKDSSINPDFYNLARFILASIGVASSELKRAGDLRYRLYKELNPPDFSPFDAFRNKYTQVLQDINSFLTELADVKCLHTTALEFPNDYEVRTHLIITSPPYLNGTNYFRNTKIELWLAGFIQSETELGGLRDQAMAAGINDISKRGRKPIIFPEVEKVAKVLDDVAYDKRIPEMIRRYFSDSMLWLTNCYNLLEKGGSCIVDIGDSRFAGVHIPVDEILVSIAKEIGFKVSPTRFVRNRKSKDGSPLKQVLLILEKSN